MTFKPASLLALLLAGAVAVPALAQTKQPIPVPAAPTDLTYNSLRAVQYCELWLFTGTPETGLGAVYYNTSDLNNRASKLDTCPPGMWAKVDPKGLAARYDILMAYKNGPRGWTMDSITLPVGPVETFDGVQARWMGEGKLPKGMAFKGEPPAYHEVESHRKSSMTFQKGKPVFILEDAQGTPYVMQAFSKSQGPFADLRGPQDSRSQVEAGCGLEVPGGHARQRLDDRDAQGLWWVVFDELGNAYDGCKEGACNFKP